MDNVSWNDAKEFIRKLNAATGKKYRLPTEAEWEYAARSGSRNGSYEYRGSNTVGDIAWYQDNSGGKTHPVGTKQANELGIYDMSGNVEEWCNDWDGDYSCASQTNPQGPSSGSQRVLRGSIRWNSRVPYVYASFRGSSFPNDSFKDDFDIGFGFRLACSSE
ncbi:hypothetical protein FACS189435_4560 [Bacteroidia bacterium]|nr:hypothetical protein FACS189435_4560 [Bacteroidia bacterium]